MKIYTKTGDKGHTSLYDGTRVPKNDIHVESYGTIDELSSVIGVARQYSSDKEIEEILFKVQELLFNVAGELATLDGEKFPGRVGDDDIKWLEEIVDKYLEQMEESSVFKFIVPGSNKFSANMHVARTVCRRAERLVLTMAESCPVTETIMKFINRLSDMLYMIARYSETELHLVEFDK